MIKSEAIGELVKDLVKAKAEFPSFKKEGSAKMTGYSYEYLELPEILEIVNPILSKNNLVMVQEPETSAEWITVTTWLFHSSGEFIQFAPYSLPVVRPSKEGRLITTLGGLVTFARRYSIQPILGIAGADIESDETIGGDAAALKSQPPKKSNPKKMSPPKTTAEKVGEIFGGGNKPQEDRQKLIDEIGEIVNSEEFREEYKNKLRAAVGAAKSTPEIERIRAEVIRAVEIIHEMADECFTADDRDMMHKNFLEADNLGKMSDLLSQTKKVKSMRTKKEGEELF